MYAAEKQQDGLGVAWFLPVILGAISSATAGRVLSPKAKTPTAASLMELEKQEEQKRKETLVYIAAGGVLLVFILASMRR